MIADKYTFKVVATQGPSMAPIFDSRNTLVLLDCFTTRFIRRYQPHIGEIVVMQNPFKPGCTIVKRVIALEGEYAEFFSYKTSQMEKVLVPEGHIWVEGDNKENSKDCRDFGPISLNLLDGVVRAKIWPLTQA